jgi:Putative beta-barrel porin 2
MRVDKLRLAFLMCSCLSTPAFAQTDTDTSILTDPASGAAALPGPQTVQQRPGTQPNVPSLGNVAVPSVSAAAPRATIGVPFAGGVLYTGIAAITFYDDNVFASNANRFSDTVFVARPEFAWAKRDNGYTINTDGFIEARRYAHFDSEDQVNGSFGTSFTVSPDSDTQIVGNARYTRAHVDRGSSDTIGPGGVLLSTTFDNPIEYDQGNAALALNKRFGRWWTSVGVAGTIVSYTNPLAGTTTIDLSYNDGGIVVANGRVGYVIQPQTSVFVEAAGNTRNWDVSTFNSSGYRLVGGALFEQGPEARLKGEIWGGYMNQMYNGPSFQTVSTWTYGIGLTYRFTDQFSGTIEGKRDAKESALGLGQTGVDTIGANAAVCAIGGGASCVSAVESSISGRLEYRILPNLAVGGGVSLVVDSYLGTEAGGRSDRTLSPLASVKYFASDQVSFGFDYRRVNFDPTGGAAANVAAVSYFRDVYLVSMNGKF